MWGTFSKAIRNLAIREIFPGRQDVLVPMCPFCNLWADTHITGKQHVPWAFKRIFLVNARNPFSTKRTYCHKCNLLLHNAKVAPWFHWPYIVSNYKLLCFPNFKPHRGIWNVSRTIRLGFKRTKKQRHLQLQDIFMESWMLTRKCMMILMLLHQQQWLHRLQRKEGAGPRHHLERLAAQGESPRARQPRKQRPHHQQNHLLFLLTSLKAIDQWISQASWLFLMSWRNYLAHWLRLCSVRKITVFVSRFWLWTTQCPSWWMQSWRHLNIHKHY